MAPRPDVALAARVPRRKRGAAATTPLCITQLSCSMAPCATTIPARASSGTSYFLPMSSTWASLGRKPTPCAVARRPNFLLRSTGSRQGARPSSMRSIRACSVSRRYPLMSSPQSATASPRHTGTAARGPINSDETPRPPSRAPGRSSRGSATTASAGGRAAELFHGVISPADLTRVLRHRSPLSSLPYVPDSARVTSVGSAMRTATLRSAAAGAGTERNRIGYSASGGGPSTD